MISITVSRGSFCEMLLSAQASDKRLLAMSDSVSSKETSNRARKSLRLTWVFSRERTRTSGKPQVGRANLLAGATLNIVIILDIHLT